MDDTLRNHDYQDCRDESCVYCRLNELRATEFEYDDWWMDH